jgi:hypothetical protein
MVSRKKPLAGETARDRRAANKIRLESAIVEFIKMNGIQWNDFQRKYKLSDNDKHHFYRLGKPNSSYRSIIRFHELIYGPMVFGVTSAAAAISECIDNVDIKDKSIYAYIRDEYSQYEGDYALIRPSIHEKNVIYGYMAKIYWDEDCKSHRVALDSPGSVLTNGSVVFIVRFGSVCINFSDGQNNCVLLLKISTTDSNLYGVMLSIVPTVNEHHYAPASVPVVLVRQERHIPLGSGYISAQHPLYEKCLELIASVPLKDVVMNGWWNL